MTGFDPVPDRETVEEVRQRLYGTADAFDRVYDVILGVTKPTPYPEIATIANCSPSTAKRQLERLVEMRIVRVDRDSRPARYDRNDGYFEWREVDRIATERTLEEIDDRIEELEARRETFHERFGTSDPSTISLLDAGDHESIHTRMDLLGEWQAVERDIQRYDLAYRLLRDESRLVSNP